VEGPARLGPVEVNGQGHGREGVIRGQTWQLDRDRDGASPAGVAPDELDARLGDEVVPGHGKQALGGGHGGGGVAVLVRGYPLAGRARSLCQGVLGQPGSTPGIAQQFCRRHRLTSLGI
jgi:hypothetical protein